MKNENVSKFFDDVVRNPYSRTGADVGFCPTRAHWLYQNFNIQSAEPFKIWVYVDKQEPKERFGIYGGDIECTDLFIRGSDGQMNESETWGYHCAFGCEIDGQTYIIDPAFQNGPELLDQYLLRFQSSNGRDVQCKITHPAIYNIADALNEAPPKTGILHTMSRLIAVRASLALSRLMNSADIGNPEDMHQQPE